jgi:hypothetical protein
LHTLHVPPSFAQFLQDEQFEHARHTPTGLHVAFSTLQQLASALGVMKYPPMPRAAVATIERTMSLVVFTTPSLMKDNSLQEELN